MKVYSGERTIDGIVVVVDDQPLDQRLDLRAYSENGFEWTYDGNEPRQLALALLADHLGDDRRALVLASTFATHVVVNFDNEWEMTGEDIDAALAAIT